MFLKLIFYCLLFIASIIECIRAREFMEVNLKEYLEFLLNLYQLIRLINVQLIFFYKNYKLILFN